jgi:hypothetical protein
MDIGLLSTSLDKFVFSPIFENSNASKDSSLMVDKILSSRPVKKMNKRLENLKLSSFALGVLFAFTSIRSMSLNVPLVILYGCFAADCFRISYNCYIKNYVSISVQYLGGDFKAITSTILQVASSTLGMSNDPDPLIQLEHGFYWKSIFHQTISGYVFSKVSIFLI